jgi:Flp pilus assembly pilin Flp
MTTTKTTTMTTASGTTASRSVPTTFHRLQARLVLAAHDDERGQATAEYALVLLGAAAIALLVVSWATKTNVIAKLLDAIFGQLLGRTATSRAATAA